MPLLEIGSKEKNKTFIKGKRPSDYKSADFHQVNNLTPPDSGIENKGISKNDKFLNGDTRESINTKSSKTDPGPHKDGTIYSPKHIRDLILSETENFPGHKERILKKISEKLGLSVVVGLNPCDIRLVFVLTVLSTIHQSSRIKASRSQMEAGGVKNSKITSATKRLEQFKIIKKHERTLDDKNCEFVEFELLF
jgi:hypothetical protein